MKSVLLIGATGAFGQRLARLLAGIPQLDVILTSRSQERAQVVRDALHPHARCASLTAMAFQREQDDAQVFEKLRPWLVIDASGPFQSAGYATARAAIQSGAHWIDLADAADYITGFEAALDPMARRNGVVAIAGASSTPALSFAASQNLTRGWRHIESIEIAIYPGGDADVGRAVLQAVLSYAGRDIYAWRDNAASTSIGWASPQRTQISGLGVRYRATVATADAHILPAALRVANVAFYAGLESALEQHGLALLARLRKAGWLGDLDWLAAPLQKARALTRPFASDRGGMTVTATGEDENGKHVARQWLLLARNGDGPNVPVLPALALVRGFINNSIQPGARHAAGVVSLSAIEAEMTPFALETSTSTLEPQAGLRPEGQTAIALSTA